MNCPSRPDDTERHPEWNQSPQALNSDATTRADLSGIVNLRNRYKPESSPDKHSSDGIEPATANALEPPEATAIVKTSVQLDINDASVTDSAIFPVNSGRRLPTARLLTQIHKIVAKYAHFVGPGFMIAVAYIDPGNYATDVQAGASTRYRHLFIVLLSNLFAIFLQSLCIKLGSVTGLNLAENCRKHLPRWLNIILYLFAEAAIIATDIAEVIGSAIALNLLFHIPLVAGCAITLVDVLLLLVFYHPDGTLTRLRLFEMFVMCLVLGVVVCFCIELSYIRNSTIGEVFLGYVPSSAVVEGDGVYLSCGILGATVMPHSIFLGSGVVQPRLREFDERHGVWPPQNRDEEAETKYRPSIAAVRSCLRYSIVELGLSLFTFALFVNSAILIVSGAALYPETAATEADLFGIHDLLSQNLSQVAGTIFAIALLLSGTSAGIVCTMAGQMVSEGMLHWTIKPWIRRLATRSISIVPSIIIAGAIGRNGLNQALTASQVVLSVILPFVTAPLLWFTCKSSIMTMRDDRTNGEDDNDLNINMKNNWIVTILAILIWLVLVVMNVALLVLVGLGKA